MPSTYAFIEHVVSELVAMHRAAGVPLRTLHVGGDELPQGVWERSPASQALMQREHLKSGAELWNYFYARVGAVLARHGVALAGWEEIGAHTATIGGQAVLTANPFFAGRGYTLYVWRNTEGAEDLADRLANAGYEVVLTPATRLYFDLAPYPSPLEPGQNWAGYVDLDTVFDYVPGDDTRVAPDDPRRLAHREALSAAGRAHIRGLEGTLFSETVHEPRRLDYMLMPRLLALAERAWAPDPAWTKQPDREHAGPLRAQAWATFVSQLGLQVLPRLDAEHAVLYRIPPPGLKRVRGAVLANEQIPGFSLRYTVDGSEPNAHSPQVSRPIATSGLVRVAAFDRNGRGGRSAQLDNR
jgi:hexosaminidase